MITIEYKLLESESVLEDDYPIHKGFVYIVDGVFMKSPAEGTVKDWKEIGGVGEVRKCNLFGHQFARLGDRVS